MKKPYLFEYDGELVTFEQFLTTCNDENEISKRRGLYDQVLDAQLPLEREWRDKELAATDKFMFEDSTYAGLLVKGSDLHTAILAYRHQLRNYNLRDEPRPTRPTLWSNE